MKKRAEYRGRGSPSSVGDDRPLGSLEQRFAGDPYGFGPYPVVSRPPTQRWDERLQKWVPLSPKELAKLGLGRARAAHGESVRRAYPARGETVSHRGYQIRHEGSGFDVVSPHHAPQHFGYGLFDMRGPGAAYAAAQSWIDQHGVVRATRFRDSRGQALSPDARAALLIGLYGPERAYSMAKREGQPAPVLIAIADRIASGQMAAPPIKGVARRIAGRRRTCRNATSGRFVRCR